MARTKQTADPTRLRLREEASTPPRERYSSTASAVDEEFAELFQEIDEYVEAGEQAASSSEGTASQAVGEPSVAPLSSAAEEQEAAPQLIKPRGREEAQLLPSEIHPDVGWMRWLDRHGAKMRDDLCVGEGYQMRVPAGLDSTVSLLAEGEFPVYAASIKLGMRFPPHPFVVEVLDGFNIGVAQLTPNSWADIFGYIAKCALNDVEPSFNAFLHLVSLSRSPSAAKGWFNLSSRGTYQTVVGKLSKWHMWRKRWVVFYTDDQEMYERMSRWNCDANFMDRDEPLPPLTAEEWDQIMVLFRANTYHLTVDKSFHVPAEWLPHISQFRNEAFLAAVGLGYSMTRGCMPIYVPFRVGLFIFSNFGFLLFTEEGMSKLSAADIGKGDMTDWMADIYEAKMQKAKAELEEKQAKDAARASGKKKGTTLSQLKKRAVPAGSETPSTFKKPKPLPRRLVKKDESKVAEGGCPDDEEMGVDKPSLVVDLVEDPLSGIPADVRSQIPAEVARRARSSGAKDKGKDAAAAEDENVPATPHYSSKDRVAICRKVFKAVPAEYVASLPGRKTDAQFGAIQATLLDLFCRMEFCKSWKTRTAEELKAQVAESTHHGDYAFKSIEEVRLQMQTTIDLQAKEVAALRSDKAELLKKILAQDKDMVAMVEEAKTAAAEIRALQDQLREYPQVKEAAEEAEHLRGELETARSQVRTLRERLLESYDQGEQATKDAVKHAWESHMSEYDLGWFQRRMEHSAAVLAAERLGQPPPEFVSSDDEDDAAAP
ncbi:uncharacterized protein [Spinacia oleracea]|uniref:Uncharacterized protein isoform X2 n=4 Tax=Spinacia oleracea TaxID=3562 RepID=A0ABM3QNS0_SPIOL|nr:uncharacterized protein LOC130461090 isoform X2 [Spinacia oleracea]